MNNINVELAIKIFHEMELNYKSQYPKEVPNFGFIVDIIIEECNK